MAEDAVMNKTETVYSLAEERDFNNEFHIHTYTKNHLILAVMGDLKEKCENIPEWKQPVTLQQRILTSSLARPYY